MKLECVLTAVNDNKLYIDFIDIFIKSWNKLYPYVDVKIILISNKIPDEYKKYSENIILFEPIKGISTAYISQYIRLLYPCILNYNSIMITDIDNIPMNKDFFSKNIEDIPNTKWVNLRDWVYNKEICMMWQIASSATWREVFSISNLDEIKERLIEVNKNINYENKHGGRGWNKDQLDLYKYVMNWKNKESNYVVLKDSDTKFNRLNRGSFNSDDLLISNIKGKYSDYHCLRPMATYKDINYRILEFI